MICSVDGCGREVCARGLCENHYRRMKRNGSTGLLPARTPLADRFWPKVERRGVDECWPWIGYANKLGYGYIGSGGRDGTMLMAHRVSYELNKGPIPEGLYVLHGCDNPNCVNPGHLRAGTPKENTLDAVSRGRIKNPPRTPGAQNTKAKLTEVQVKFIRDNAERFTARQMSELFGVSFSTIRRIVLGKLWKQE